MKKCIAIIFTLFVLLTMTAFSGCSITIKMGSEPTATEPPAEFVGYPSVGLDFSMYDSYCVVSGIGVCKDTDIIIPTTVNGLPVTGISASAFAHCENLTSIYIPDNVTRIEDVAFNRCTSLVSVHMPDSLSYIGNYAFYQCDSLTNITYAGTIKQWKAFQREVDWNPDGRTTEVICSDGKVNLSSTTEVSPKPNEPIEEDSSFLRIINIILGIFYLRYLLS